MATVIRFTTLFVLTYFTFATVAYAKDDISSLQFTGKGNAYYLGFIKVYEAALFTEDISEPKQVLGDDISKCLQLTYSVSVDKDDFIKAANTVLNRQFSVNDLVKVQDQIDHFHNQYKPVNSGDVYSLCYNGSNQQTTLELNNTVVVVMESAEFAQTYFSIWLSENDPLDKTLREKLLGTVL